MAGDGRDGGSRQLPCFGLTGSDLAMYDMKSTLLNHLDANSIRHGLLTGKLTGLRVEAMQPKLPDIVQQATAELMGSMAN